MSIARLCFQIFFLSKESDFTSIYPFVFYLSVFFLQGYTILWFFFQQPLLSYFTTAS